MLIKLFSLGSLLYSVILLAPPLHAEDNPIDLPDLGYSATESLPKKMELSLRYRLLSYVCQEIVTDPELYYAIDNLGHRVAPPGTSQQVQYLLIKDPQVNAFSAPGGTIGINTGLMAMVEDEAELASVLAHEIAHFRQHHLARTLANYQRYSAPQIAGTIAALLLSRRSAEVGQAALATTIAASSQMQLNYSRSFEQEADNLAITYLTGTGFNPKGLATFLNRLHNQTKLSSQILSPYLLTHPLTTERIAEAEARMQDLPDKSGNTQNSRFLALQARLRVLTSSPSQDVLGYYRQLQTKKNPWDRYGYALALHQTGASREGYAMIKELQQKDPDHLGYRLAYGEIATALDEWDQAKQIYEETLALYPDNYPTLMGYAQWWLKKGNPKQALKLIEDYQRKHPNQLNLNDYQTLALAAAQNHQPGISQGYLATYHMGCGNPKTALEHLRLALKDKNLNEKEVSIFSNQIKEISSILKTVESGF